MQRQDCAQTGTHNLRQALDDLRWTSFSAMKAQTDFWQVRQSLQYAQVRGHSRPCADGDTQSRAHSGPNATQSRAGERDAPRDTLTI